MKIEIDLDQNDLAERVASMIAFESSYVDSEGERHGRTSKLSDSVAKVVKAKVAEAVDGIVKAEIEKVSREHVEDAVRAALAEGWQKTDNYGTPTGPKLGLKDRIVEFLNTRDGYYSNEKRNRIERIVEDTVKAVFDAEFKKEMEAAKAQFRSMLDTSIQQKFAEAVKAGLGLK